MEKRPLTCPHCGKEIETEECKANIGLYLSDEKMAKLREVAFGKDCGSVQQFSNQIFEQLVDKLWLKHSYEQLKEKLKNTSDALPCDSNEPYDDGESYLLHLTAAETDMLATVAEKDGYDSPEDYLHDKTLDLLYEDWITYEVALIHGISKL